MKSFYCILCLIFLFCLRISAASLDYIEQAFHKAFWIADKTTQESTMENTRTEANPNCTNISLRGKEYAPIFTPNESDSIMNIRINFIFIQKDNGTGNFSETNEEHQALFDDVMIDLNRIISSLVLPGTDCFSGTDEEMIHDTRIRFIDHRYYIRNSDIWNNNLFYGNANLCPNDYNWYLRGIDDSLHNSYLDTLKGVNIYFTEDSIVYNRCWVVQNLNDTSHLASYTGGACSQYPSYSNLNRSSLIHMPCLYSKFWWMKNIVPQLGEFDFPSWENNVRYWFVNSIAQGLAHELGHSFNLHHPNEELWYETFYPSSSCVASIMNQYGGNPHNFLPPFEIGRAYIHAMTTNMQQFIPAHTYLGVKTINSTVSFPRMRMFHSLDIINAGNVTILCDMTFSPLCSISIQSGGVMSIEEATLQSIQDTWGGITVENGGLLILSNVNIEDYNINIKSGGSVIIRNDLTITGNRYIKVEPGGYLCIDDNASINLTNTSSSIMISTNAILGCPSCIENCISSYSDLSHIGYGHIATYEETDYIQNMTISHNHIVIGNSVYAGYDVTTTKPVGEVVIAPNGRLKIKANQTTLKKDIKVELGGYLNISQ